MLRSLLLWQSRVARRRLESILKFTRIIKWRWCGLGEGETTEGPFLFLSQKASVFNHFFFFFASPITLVIFFLFFFFFFFIKMIWYARWKNKLSYSYYMNTYIFAILKYSVLSIWSLLTFFFFPKNTYIHVN